MDLKIFMDARDMTVSNPTLKKPVRLVRYAPRAMINDAKSKQVNFLPFIKMEILTFVNKSFKIVYNIASKNKVYKIQTLVFNIHSYNLYVPQFLFKMFSFNLKLVLLD